MSRSASSAWNVGCRTRQPPVDRVLPSVMQKLPDQKKPLAVQVRIFSCTIRYQCGQRHSCRQTARCDDRIPLGLPVDPEEKNSTPGSAGATSAAQASTSSGATSALRARNALHPSIAPFPSSLSIIAIWRRKGNLSEFNSPGRDVAICGSSSVRISAKSFLSTFRSNSSTETPESRSNASSSAGVENVLSGVATPPASAAPKKQEKYSSRLVVMIPTRVPLPIPQATSARATSIALAPSSP